MRIASTRIADIIRYFRQELKEAYDAGEVEAFISYCFEAYLNFDKKDIFLRLNEHVHESELLKFSFAVKQLKQHKPIQYILGWADFYKLRMMVNELVLIPRPETEELVDFIIRDNQGKTPLSILDIGTGSGCIPIALKKNLPHARVEALDVSEGALEIARKNAVLNQTEVWFFQQDILNRTTEFFHSSVQYDCIVSNPPYVTVSEKESMQRNVLDYEPHLALFVYDESPLLFYEAIADFANKHLRTGGLLYFEINAAYGPETKQLLEKKGFKNPALITDLNNKNRILRVAME
jgi:release factor glutamine methyltransferase